MVAQGADRAATEQVSFTTHKTEGYHSSDDDLKHLGPARHEHIHSYGHYTFNVQQELERKERRPVGRVALGCRVTSVCTKCE
jgi:hypothetical protein